MIGRIATTAARALYALGYYAHTRTMDAAFGKAEPFEFTGSTLPRHTNTEAQR